MIRDFFGKGFDEGIDPVSCESSAAIVNRKLNNVNDGKFSKSILFNLKKWLFMNGNGSLLRLGDD